MKVLHALLSAGRVGHLVECIESWSKLDCKGHDVTRLIVAIDDSQTRNENILEMLAKVHNCLLWRNPEKTEFENWANNQNYDKIILQEGVITESKTVETWN